MSNVYLLPHKKSMNDFKITLLHSDGSMEKKSINKLQMTKLTGLHFRDVRLHLTQHVTGIFIHDHCIIINIFNLKVIIFSTFCIFYDVGQEVEIILKNFLNKVKTDDNINFEILMVEWMLSEVCHQMQNEYENMKNVIDPLLNSSLSSPSQKKSRQLLSVKNNLKKLQITVVNIFESLNDLLKNRDDMKKICFLQSLPEHDAVTSNCRQIVAKPKIHLNVDDIEDIIETYYFETDRIVDGLNIMENNIDETDDTISLMLDISRNKIMLIDLWLNYITLSISIGALITGLFGMNVTNKIENSYTAFHIIWVSIIIIVIFMAIAFHSKIKTIKI